MIHDKLKQLGIKQDLYAFASVMCLPENILTESELDKLVEPSDQIWLVKRLREEGLNVFTLYDAHIDAPNLERRGDERWYGHVVIDKIAIPVLVGVLSGAFVVTFDRATRVDELPAKVHIDLTVKDQNEESHFNYDGDGETLGGLKIEVQHNWEVKCCHGKVLQTSEFYRTSVYPVES